jgi:hypothetical protein
MGVVGSLWTNDTQTHISQEESKLTEDPPIHPSIHPSNQPTTQSSIQPTNQPPKHPSNQPTNHTIIHPTNQPTTQSSIYTIGPHNECEEGETKTRQAVSTDNY